MKSERSMVLCKMVAGGRGCSRSSSVKGLAAFSVGLLAVAAAFVVVTANGKTIQIVAFALNILPLDLSIVNFERSNSHVVVLRYEQNHRATITSCVSVAPPFLPNNAEFGVR